MEKLEGSSNGESLGIPPQGVGAAGVANAQATPGECESGLGYSKPQARAKH